MINFVLIRKNICKLIFFRLEKLIENEPCGHNRFNNDKNVKTVELFLSNLITNSSRELLEVLT